MHAHRQVESHGVHREQDTDTHRPAQAVSETVVVRRDPSWLVLGIRRRPGWERRIRQRRLAAVITLCLMTLSGSPPWSLEAPYRLRDMGRDGALWYLTFSAWPDWERELHLLSYDKMAVDQAEAAFWRVGRMR